MKTFAIALAAGLAFGILGAILSVSAGLSDGRAVAVSGGLAAVGAVVFALLPWGRPQSVPRFDQLAPGQYPPAPVRQPGVVPLRPLSVGEIFTGAVDYVRINPAATLGVSAANALVFLLIGVVTEPAARSEDLDVAGVAALLTGLAGIGLVSILVTGLLTVLVARAVLGVRITAAQAWRRVRGRIPALIGLTLLGWAAAAVPILLFAFRVYPVAVANPAVLALLVPLVLAVAVAVIIAAYGLLALTPVVIVLENRSVPAAIRRSVALCRPQFWRVVGILLLAALVDSLVSGAVSVLFRLATAGTAGIGDLGQAIGLFITAPFIAGVPTLLYFDARFRLEHWLPTFVTRTTTSGLGSNDIHAVYASGYAVFAATGGGLSISTDGGRSFTTRTTADGLGSDDVSGVYASGHAVFAATDGGLSISTDGGTTFTNKTTADGLASNYVADVYGSGDTVYAATDGGLSISTDGGTTFATRTAADGLGSDCVADVHAGGDTVYAATDGGLSISTDGGSTFTNKTGADGLGSNIVFGVWADAETIYAATDGGLSISTDGGTTFANRTPDDGLGSSTVFGVWAGAETVYAATDGGLSISTDGGTTFTNRTPDDGLGGDKVLGVWASPDTVYATSGGGLSLAARPDHGGGGSPLT